MRKFEYGEVRPERGGEARVGSAPQAELVWMYVHEEGCESAATEMTPAEARALAELLLKHADRAEGKT